MTTKQFFRWFLISMFWWGSLWMAKEVKALEIDMAISEGPALQNVRYLSWPAYEGTRQETIPIVNGTSQIFRFDRPIVRVAISNADVCDITTLSRQEVLINAKDMGRVNLLVWDEGNRIASYDVQSMIDVERLEEILSSIDSEANLEILPFEDTVVVYGSAETAIKVQQIEDTLAAFDEKGTSLVTISEPKQILLEVRFAEVSRKANKDFGIDTELISHFISTRSFLGRTSSTDADADGSFSSDEGVVTIEPIALPLADSSTDLMFLYASNSTLFNTFPHTPISFP